MTISPSVTAATDLRRMSTIQVLKYGLAHNLWKKAGWMCDLLKGAGIMDGSKQSTKEICWQYYKGQLLYIEAMQEAKDDSTFDPRRNDHITGKDGRFTKKKNASALPKNPLTIQYLCHACDIPYATFKRWKKDAFVSKKYVPETKGKSVISDKKLASQIFNARRMFIKHNMGVWLEKHPEKKYVSKAKKVRLLYS